MKSPITPLPSVPVAFFDLDAPYTDTAPPPKSTVFEVPGTKLKRGSIGGINGLGNSLEEAQKNASYLSQLSGNNPGDKALKRFFEYIEKTVADFLA